MLLLSILLPSSVGAQMSESKNLAQSIEEKELFPLWRLIVFTLGIVGSTITASINGLVTYFYVPPETVEAAFPQYIEGQTFLGFTILGVVVYIAGLTPMVLNPLAASLSDRSHSTLGRRRSFMLASFLPLGLMSYLVFTPPVDGVSWINSAYLLIILVLMHASRAFYDVSLALFVELGRNSRLMTLFSTFSSLGWILGYVIGSEVVFVVKDAFMSTGASPVEAFRLTVGILIGVALVMNLAQILVLDEKRYGTGVASSTPLLPALKTAVTNRSFLLFVFTQQVYYWGDFFFQMGMIYFVTVLFGLPESMILLFGAAIVVISLALYPLVNIVVRHVPNKVVYTLGLLIQALVLLIVAASPWIPIPGIVLIWIIVFLASITAAITGIVPNTIQNEIIREDCLRNNAPNEAAFQASQKLLTAIPSGFAGLLLPSILLLGRSVENPKGVQVLALVGALCVLAAVVMLQFYNESRVRQSLKEKGYV